jgi:prepilin-type processing-associated H-X9-DG protein
MRNVWELLIVVGVVVLLAILIIPVLQHTGHESRQRSCSSNLGQIIKACTTYQEPNDDFFPAFMQGCSEGQSNPNIPRSGQGSDNTFQPMPSLACLYPAYIDNVKFFGCPKTADKPQIAFRYYYGSRHTCFGFEMCPNETGQTTDNRDPAAFSGAELSGNAKCSYFYDELTNFRKIGPGQAIACDADGQTWLDAHGNTPPYPTKGWTRQPRKPNHPNGQNVMYFDGHVKWMEGVYSSRDPKDNIFCPNSTNGIRWDADSDAYLWDGVNARAVENR